MKHNPRRGSAIMMIFVAIALFAALGYAFVRNTTGSTTMMLNEAAKAGAIQSQDCTNTVNTAAKRLSLRGCTAISYNTDGTNDNPGAPLDGSCSMFHIQGGGVSSCNSLGRCSSTQLSALAIGANCYGEVYAGLSPDGSIRMYAMASDISPSHPSTAWNAGNGSDEIASGISSATTGAANTASLAIMDSNAAAWAPGIQPHNAAKICNDLIYAGKDDWYLPARNEMNILYTNRAAIGNFTSLAYWTSTEASQTHAYGVNFADGSNFNYAKSGAQPIRCVRKQ